MPEPEIQETNDETSITLKSFSERMGEKMGNRMGEKRGNRMGEKRGEVLSENRRNILEAIRENPQVTHAEWIKRWVSIPPTLLRTYRI